MAIVKIISKKFIGWKPGDHVAVFEDQLKEMVANGDAIIVEPDVPVTPPPPPVEVGEPVWSVEPKVKKTKKGKK